MADAPASNRPTVPPFDPRRFERQLAIDAAVRHAALMVLGVAAALAILFGDAGLPIGGLHLSGLSLLILGAAPWLLLGIRGAQLLRPSQEIQRHLDQRRTAEAEQLLASALRRWPQSPRSRFVLHRQLAQVRHQQRRFSEAGAIGAALLSHDPLLRRRPEVHGDLLLLTVEAWIEARQLHAAWQGLLTLHALPLRLEQMLARLLLQVQYEVLIGADAAVLAQWHRKVELAELMPQPLCGTLHALLAVAARRGGRDDLRPWLEARARLLGPRQLRGLYRQFDLAARTAAIAP